MSSLQESPHFRSQKRPIPIGETENMHNDARAALSTVMAYPDQIIHKVTLVAMSLHPSDLGFAKVLLKARVEVVPPLVKHAFADQLEPGCEFERLVFEHGPKVFLRDESRVANFVRVGVEVNVSLDEQDVVDCIVVSHVLPESPHVTTGHATQSQCHDIK
jgi:hypothetical protein